MRFLVLLLFFLNSFSQSSILSQAESGFVQNEDVQIHYKTIGQGPLIIMIHGFPDYWYSWRNQMEILYPHYQVVAMDLRGYNKSDKPIGVENYTFRKILSDIAALIKHFPQKKAIIIGHDWGGALTWQMGIWYPHLVEKLIVLSTPHPNGLTRELRNNTAQAKNSDYARKFQEEKDFSKYTPEYLASWVKDDEAKPYYIEAFKRSSVEGMLNYYKANFPSAGTKSSNSTIQTKRIQAPVLGIFGMEDKALLPAGWNATWDWIDNSFELKSIPNAAHFVHHDNAEQVNKVILSFLGITKATQVKQDLIKPFDRLLGKWTMSQEQRQQDGTWKLTAQKFQWDFYTILGGEAIQDDWKTVSSNGETQITGTNLRIYNPDEKIWYMNWIDIKNRAQAIFTAKEIDGKIIMSGKNAKGREVRNTFSEFSAHSFRWKQEWTFDQGKTWIEIVKMTGQRILD